MTDDGVHVVTSAQLDVNAETTALYVCDTTSGSVSQVSAWDPNDGVALPLSNDQFLLFSGGQLSTYDFADGTVTPLEGLDAHTTVLGCSLAPDGHSLRIVFADHGDYASYDNKLTYAPTVYDLDSHQVTAQAVSPGYSFSIDSESTVGAPSALRYSANGGWITDDLSTFIVVGDKGVDAYSMSSGAALYQTPYNFSETYDYTGNSADSIRGESCEFGGQIGNILLVNNSDMLHLRTYRLDVTTGETYPLSQNSYVSLLARIDSVEAPPVSVILYNPSAALDEYLFGSDYTYSSASGTLRLAAINSATGETLWECDIDVSTLDGSAYGQITPSDLAATPDGRYCYGYLFSDTTGMPSGITVIDIQTGKQSSMSLGAPVNGRADIGSYSTSSRHVELTSDATKLIVFETLYTGGEDNFWTFNALRVSSCNTGVTLQMPAGVGATSDGGGQASGPDVGSVPVVAVALGAVAVVAAAGAVTIVVLRRRPERRRAAATPSPAPGGGPEPRALFCPHCGARQPTPGAKFCQRCGRPIR